MFRSNSARKLARPSRWCFGLLLTSLLGLPGVAAPQIPALPIGDSQVTIDGEGFFILEQGSDRSFARVALFRFDHEMILINEDGRSILGFGIAGGGVPNGALGPIVKPVSSISGGFLARISFDEQGFVNGTWANGETQRLFQIALAVFAAPHGLKNVGTRFLQTADSGSPVIGSPGVATNGTLQARFTDSCERELDICVFTGSVDLDGDAVLFANDRCPDTHMPSDVDDVGCSLQQFCSLIDTTRPRGLRACHRSDWRNDEPLKARPRDCRPIRDPDPPYAFQCIAR